MKRFRLFLIILFILTIVYLSIWLEPPLPWLLIYPGLAHRSWDVQTNYSKRSEKDKTKFKENIKNKLLKNPYVFMKNNYPYHVQADHWVLWIRSRINEKKVQEIIEKEIGITHKRDWTYYENPPYLRSVPDMIHYHVFIKKYS